MNPNAIEHGQIYFHDIGDYLSQSEKLGIIRSFKSIAGIEKTSDWKPIMPDAKNDWLNQTDRSFDRFLVMGDKKDKIAVTLFGNYSSGVKTNRDAWCYNFAKIQVAENIGRTISFYNSEVKRYQASNRSINVDAFINTDPTKISWDFAERQGVVKGRSIDFDEVKICESVYRPFSKQWLYYSKDFNNRTYQMPRIFPNSEIGNLVICITGVGANNGSSVLLCDTIPDLNMLAAGAQCFPLKLYEPTGSAGDDDLFAGQSDDGYRVRDGITDEGLQHFLEVYPGEQISKEDLFYYIYGLLHSPDYRERFQNNLSKQLPRIPPVKKAEDFWAFSRAGRALGDLHVNYETVDPYPVTFREGALELSNFTEADYRVEKMKFSGKRGNEDKTTVIYNHKITMENIPLEAYDYVVNGKPALAWVMERQCVKTDKASGIVNDANDYAIETVGDAAYPLKLFQRVITVSLETMKIVRSLPKLDID